MVTAIEPLRMNLRDAAKFLGVSPRKFQRIVSAGMVRYVTDPGGVRMYPTAQLRKYQEKLESEQWGEQVA